MTFILKNSLIKTSLLNLTFDYQKDQLNKSLKFFNYTFSCYDKCFFTNYLQDIESIARRYLL